MPRKERDRPIRDAATQAEETLYELETAILAFYDWLADIRANGIEYEISAEISGCQAPMKIWEAGNWLADHPAEEISGWHAPMKIRGTIWPSGRPEPIAELEAKNARLLEALRKYGRHEISCDLLCSVSKLHPGACDCGWEAVLAVIEQEGKP